MAARFIAGVALAAAAILAPTASAGTDYTFKAMLECRAPGAFEGTVDIYHRVAMNDFVKVATLTCSDSEKTVKADLTINVENWDNEDPLADTILMEFRSTAFVNVGGCFTGTGVAGLENQGYGANFDCHDTAPDGRVLHNNWMHLMLYSAGDQPSYIGAG